MKGGAMGMRPKCECHGQPMIKRDGAFTCRSKVYVLRSRYTNRHPEKYAEAMARRVEDMERFRMEVGDDGWDYWD